MLGGPEFDEDHWRNDPMDGFYNHDCHRAIFHAHFSPVFLNLVTHTLAHLFHSSLAILVFHPAFTLSTCYSTNDSYELL